MRIRDREAVQRRRDHVARVMARAAVTPTPPQAAQPEPRTMKAKVHTVTLESGKRYLVMARTKAGARRDLRDYILGEADVDLATGEDIYDAALSGEEIIGRDKYRATTDPNQIPLDGVPETVNGEGDKPATPF